MRKTLYLGLAALLLLSACAPAGERESPTPPAASTPPVESPPVESPPVESPPADTAPPVPEQTPSSTPGGVYTDWSALEPYEPPELIFRRWYSQPVRELRPLKGGYGVLVPYVGSAQPDDWGSVYQYGLMTADGTIVVDTVYSDVYRLTLEEGGETARLDVLALMTTEPVVEEEYGYTYGEQRCGAAALDGSWAIPMEYDGIQAFSAGGFILWDEEAIYVYHTDGQLWDVISCGDTGKPLGWGWVSEGMLVKLEEATLRLIDLERGESVYVEGVSEAGRPGNGLFPARVADSGLCGCVDRTGAWVIPARYEDMPWPLGDGSGLMLVYVDGAKRFVDREGNEYTEDPRPPQESKPVCPVEDSYTGETWYLRDLGYLMEEDRWRGYLIEDAAGNVLGNSTASNARCIVVNGLFFNIDGETAGYKDRDGNWVFRIRLAQAGD